MTLDARPFLGQIKVPTLILAPSQSAATSVEEQRKLAAQIPGSRLEVIDGVGHEIYVTQPVKCQTAFLDFLGSLSR